MPSGRPGAIGATWPRRGNGELVALPLPPEVAGRAQPGLRDLRLVNRDGQEVAVRRRPHRGPRDRPALDGAAPRRATATSRAPRTTSGGRPRSSWTSKPRERSTRIVLDIPDRDFAKRVRVEASDDRAAWRVLDDDAGRLRRRFGAAAYTTPRSGSAAPATARFLRFSVADRRGSPAVTINGVVVAAHRLAEGRSGRRPVSLQRRAGVAAQPIPDSTPVSRWRRSSSTATIPPSATRPARGGHRARGAHPGARARRRDALSAARARAQPRRRRAGR